MVKPVLANVRVVHRMSESEPQPPVFAIIQSLESGAAPKLNQATGILLAVLALVSVGLSIKGLPQESKALGWNSIVCSVFIGICSINGGASGWRMVCRALFAHYALLIGLKRTSKLEDNLCESL